MTEKRHPSYLLTPGPLTTSAEVKAATIDVDTLGVIPVDLRYEHVAPQRFRRVHLRTGIDAEFAVDQYGLVHDEPDHFRRL